MIRNAVVAGRFYPGTASSLRTEVERLVDPGLPKDKVIGVISPHAGYIYSGPVAGATFSRIEMVDTFVILGPNHTGRGAHFSIMTYGSWHTPLGRTEIDSKLAKQILMNSDFLIEDELAHLLEHSIEVQLPFLQYFREDVKIVPILLAHTDGNTYKEIGKAISDAVKSVGQEVVIVASSDMTHYEPQESAREKDRKAIEAILALEEDELMRRVNEYGITMCGYGPTITLLVSAKELGATSAELVSYQTSGDISGDYSSVVGYAGVIIR